MATLIIPAVLAGMKSPHLYWDNSNPETAFYGNIFHNFEWIFFGIAPFAFIGSLVGAILTRKKRPDKQ